jgi:hypothetical protein
VFFAAALLLVVQAASGAVVVGRIDTFEDGTTMNWIVGAGPMGATSPVPPVNVGDGGPAGEGDAFLLLRSLGGDGPGSRLTAQNFAHWTGDYLGAQVAGISADVRNFGDTDVAMRLLILQLGPMGPVNMAISTAPVNIAAGAPWTNYFFRGWRARLRRTITGPGSPARC